MSVDWVNLDQRVSGNSSVAVTLKQFVQNLTTSGLMSATDITSFQDGLPPQNRPRDAETLARALVHANRLTKYQVQAVYQGKVKGLVFGEYCVLDQLGQGGMGIVLKAEHRRMKRIVAVKMIAGAALKSPDAVKRFYREVEAAARLEHANIVTAYDASEHEGVHYLVMQFVDGKDLGAIVKERGPLSVSQAVDYTIQAARGLQFAHKQGVVHRDIKPANLLVDKEGTLKILDMGLARIGGVVDEEDKDRLTASGQIMGTCDYMAPEQAMDTHHVDARADIYSLGCTLYRFLTGDVMYKGETLAKILISHQLSPIPSLCKACSDVLPQLDAVFQKMVAKKPEDRYQTMAEVIADLEACIGKRAAASTSLGEETIAVSPMEDNLSFLKTTAPRSMATAVKKKVEKLAEATLSQQVAGAETSKQLAGKARLQAVWRKKTRFVTIGLGLLGVVGVIAIAVIIRIRRPDGTEQVIRAPKGSEVTVSEDGSKNAKVKSDGRKAGSSSSDRMTLFDGKTLNGWHLRDPNGPQCWAVEDGYLVCTPQPQSDAKNLVTDWIFGDFELRLEFLLEAEANSGVYLRGLYEVQVCDSDPQDLGNASCGAIFKVFAPSQKAYLGPRQWNSLDVKMVGQQVTVVMNGRCIIENGTLSKPTDNKHTLDIQQGDPGPIMLQCMANGRSQFRNISICRIGGQPTAHSSAVDDAFIKEVTALPAEQQVARVVTKLKELNPGYDGNGAHKIEGNEVVELSFLPTKVSDISPIRALSKLQKLGCWGGKTQSGMVADLSPLRNMQLVELKCGGNPIRDFSPLRNMPLNVLWCPGTKLADLSVLKGLPLTELGLDNTEVSDLSPLQGMSLITLWVDCPKITNLSPLKGMLSLRRVFINCSQVADLSPLTGLPLTDLDCENTLVKDLSPLRDMPLKDLRCDFDPKRDIEILRSIKTLERINGLPAAEFWRQVEERTAPKPTTDADKQSRG